MDWDPIDLDFCPAFNNTSIYCIQCNPDPVLLAQIKKEEREERRKKRRKDRRRRKKH
jgi:hypothetical protein